MPDLPPFPQADFEPDPRLVAEGWERRFMADPQRAREAQEMFLAMGFEVRLEPVRRAEFDNALCQECALSAECLNYVTVYVRKR